MAMLYAQMRSMLENSTGYYGGRAIDELPDLTLDEAVGGFSCALMEGQETFLKLDDNHTTIMYESAMNGDGIDTMSMLIEGSFDSIKKHITSFFEKVKKFIKSIIAKLGLMIDKMRMSGQALYDKYKDSDLFNRDFSDSKMTYNGYVWTTEDVFGKAKGFDSSEGVQKLVTTATGRTALTAPDAMSNAIKTVIDGYDRTDDKGNKTHVDGDDSLYAKDSVNDKGLRKVIEDMTKGNSEDRKARVASALVGIEATGSEWKSKLTKKLYPEKKDIKYGSNGFSKDGIKAVLEAPSDLSEIREQYEALHNTAKDLEDTLNNSSDECKRYFTDKKPADKSGTSNAQTLASKYYTAYLSILSDVMSVINDVKGMNINYRKAQFAQAKGMLGKLLSYKAPKKDNNDASDFDMDLALISLDFDV